MATLYGFPRSNYYRLAKAALIEKGIEFTDAEAVPSQKDEMLARSPMGRIPYLELDGQFISETWAIIDYAEQISPEPSLFPAEPVARARCIELARHLELNVELVARRCLAAAFFGADASDELRSTTRADLERGMAAIDRLLVGDGPYLMGDTFSIADLYAHYTFVLAPGIAEATLDLDLLDGHATLQTRLSEIAKRPSIVAAG